MSFLHCHSCRFSQDDFWEVGSYNPFRTDILDHWVKIMKEGISFKKPVKMEIWWAEEVKLPYKEVNGQAEIDFRDYLAWELERKAENIRNMKWVTWEDFKDEPNKVCPKCGADDLDID